MIIIGGGPAGLLLARELSKEHSVLVLEKGRIGDTTRSWVTYRDRWEELGFPEDFITHAIDEWRFFADGEDAEIVLRDDFICFDEHAFLHFLGSAVRDAGAEIHEHVTVTDIKQERDRVIVNGSFEARLVVDCAGIGSPTLRDGGVIEEAVYLPISGYIMDSPPLERENYYAMFSMEDGKCGYLGVNRVSEDRVMVNVFRHTKERVKGSSMDSVLEYAKEHFGIPDGRIVETKRSVYPTGLLATRSLDRLFLFGDAGFYAPGFTGMGFNEILRQHRAVAAHLGDCLSRDALSARDLAVPEPLLQDIDNTFFHVLGLMFVDAPFLLVQRLVADAAQWDAEMVRRAFRNSVTDAEVVSVFRTALRDPRMRDAIRYIPRGHVLPLLKLFLQLDAELLEDEVLRLFRHHHGESIPDMRPLR